MEVIEGVRLGALNYVYKLYVYNEHCQKRNTKYLVCTKDGCRGKIAYNVVANTIKETFFHNHHPEPLVAEKLKFRNELNLEAQRDMLQPLRTVYERVSRSYPLAAKEVEFASIESRMYRARRKVRPPTPKTMGHFVEILRAQEWKHLGMTLLNESFFKAYLIAEDGGEIMVFGCPTLCKLLQNSDEICIDGTFRMLRDYPLTIIHAVYLDKMYAAVYALMTIRTASAYRCLLDYIKRICIGFCPHSATFDFEEGIRVALDAAFPGIVLNGSWFHFAQAIIQKHHKLGMRSLCDVNENAKKALKMLMVLPLLPKEQIALGLFFIEDWVERHYLARQFRNLLKNVNSLWLKNGGADTLSAYHVPRHTNNNIQHFHLQFLRHMEITRPSVWYFMKKLIEINQGQSATYQAERNGSHTHWPQRPCDIEQNMQIRQAEIALETGQYTIGEFLEHMSHCVQNLEEQLKDIYSRNIHVEEDMNEDQIESPAEDLAHYSVVVEPVVIVPIQLPAAEQVEEVLVPAEILENLKTCPICLESGLMDRVFMPCEHALCVICVGLLNEENITQQCPVCRTEISTIVRLS